MVVVFEDGAGNKPTENFNGCLCYKRIDNLQYICSETFDVKFYCEPELYNVLD